MHTLCSSTSAIPPISENRRRQMQYTHKDTCNNQTLSLPTTPLGTLTHKTPPQHTLAGNSWTTSDLRVVSIVLGLLDTPSYIYLPSTFLLFLFFIPVGRGPFIPDIGGHYGDAVCFRIYIGISCLYSSSPLQMRADAVCPHLCSYVPYSEVWVLLVLIGIALFQTYQELHSSLLCLLNLILQFIFCQVAGNGAEYSLSMCGFVILIPWITSHYSIILQYFCEPTFDTVYM